MSRRWPKAVRDLAPWLDHAPRPGSAWRQNPPPVFPPPAASGYGRDEYGLWYQFDVAGVTQKMRWIVAGEFMMGSPKSEPERGGQEHQHPVRLCEGFWLANTACTQALWQVVMENSPSHFNGDTLPVENVSHDKVLEFCKRLNNINTGLKCLLPTEAQWEYACRASGQTAFWWGDNLLPEQANFDRTKSYNHAPKDEESRGTVSVTDYPPNPWGLYQMHGNVWEWCSDWYDDYPRALVVDPIGPAAGDFRVLRGGSWHRHGSGLRAAYRFASPPVNRSHNFGFRLAQSARPESQRETKPASAAAAGKQSAG